jgi:fructosamine-3-kinase
MEKALDRLKEILGEPQLVATAISGGDTAQAFLLAGKNGRYFLKTSLHTDALALLRAEAVGLEKLRATQTIAIPKVITLERIGAQPFLVLEYIESKKPEPSDFEKLGYDLAALHTAKCLNNFGAASNNFIGSLRQSNRKHTHWADFYIIERLWPQLRMAASRKLLGISELPKQERLDKFCSELFTGITPSLLHGDLWGGNFLISNSGTPYLIDPSHYRGHNEVDLAMSRLFGGFGPSFYQAYREIIPTPLAAQEYIDLYQLYYLLVHLTHFGPAYNSQVSTLLTRYFS